MTREEILEYNKRCAEFLGYLQHGNLIVIANIPTHVSNGKYHSDWNWIMEIVEAIERKTIDGYPFVLTMTVHNVFIENPMVLDNSYIVQAVIKDSKKEAIVQAINQFLIWYNENK